MYPINIDNQTIYLRHEPCDVEKINALRDDMIANGYKGRPVIVANCGDHQKAFTGVHRLYVAADLDITADIIELPDTLTADDWDLLDDANDDYDLLDAFEMIAENRDDMNDIVAVMIEELQ